MNMTKGNEKLLGRFRTTTSHRITAPYNRSHAFEDTVALSDAMHIRSMFQHLVLTQERVMTLAFAFDADGYRAPEYSLHRCVRPVVVLLKRAQALERSDITACVAALQEKLFGVARGVDGTHGRGLLMKIRCRHRSVRMVVMAGLRSDHGLLGQLIE